METQLAPPGETVQPMPPLIFEADFWFVFNRKVLFMKSVINFGIGTKRVGWSRFGSEHWVETKLALPGETVQATPHPIV